MASNHNRKYTHKFCGFVHKRGVDCPAFIGKVADAGSSTPPTSENSGSQRTSNKAT